MSVALAHTVAPADQVRTWLTCPVCLGADATSWVEFDQLAFVRCGDCGVVYKRREAPTLRPPDFYEKAYFHGRKSGRDRRFEHRVRKATAQIRTALQFGSARSMLDVGCSFGYVIEAGKRLGMSAAGVDISQYAVEVCQSRGYRAKAATLEQLPFADGEFDLVMMKHVLEHTPDPRRALAEVRRVLSPNGVTLIAVPDLEYWKGLYQRRGYRYFRPDDLGQQHYVYYTLPSLSRLLGECGFELMAHSKAFFRSIEARKSPLHRVTEALRFAGYDCWQKTARALRMRRELFVIARRAT
jgi:SAM-dependent methyltransferase